MPPRARWLLAALLLTGCASEPRVDLAVDLRTDLVPGREFVAVRTSARRTAIEHEGVTFGDRAYLAGARVAELMGLSPGPTRVLVELLDEDGGVVVERSVQVELEVSTAITVLVSRSCAGVVCPPPDDPSLESCFAGQCVDPGCLWDEPSCPGQCSVDADCAAEEPCARARCERGICLVELDDGLCGAGERCTPGCGCAPAPPAGGVGDPNRYCGACGVDCTAWPNADARCADGACVLVGCLGEHRDCDGDPTNGCERIPVWSAEDGGDHCGEDWAPDGSATIGGVHTSVGRFEIPDGAVVTVPPFDGAVGGALAVEAETISIAGTLDLTGRGPLGGDGGRGQRSGNPYCGGDGGGGATGQGDFGGGGGGGGSGHGGSASTDSGCRYADGRAGGAGRPGGYAAAQTNGDTSEDDEVWMGSGGGGGGGGGSGSRFGSNNNFPAGTGGGGGAGGRGGGTLRLEASGELRVDGAILARGTADGGDGRPGDRFSGCERYQDPRGGDGGSAAASGASAAGDGRCQDFSSCGGGSTNTCGGRGGIGGGGAGGGVLLRGRTVAIAPGAIDLRGGRPADDNGGTLKIRYACELAEEGSLVGRLDAREDGRCE